MGTPVPPAVAAVLSSPEGRVAVLAGDTGTVVRLARRALGWSQADLARRTGFHQSTISRLEQGSGRIGEVAVRGALGGALGIPRAALGLSGARRDDPSTLGDVRRSEFVRGLLGTAAALALPESLAGDDPPGRVGAETVRQCREALRRLYDLDDRGRATSAYTVADLMARRMRTALDRCTYSPATGRALAAVTAATTEHAGWLSFDSGHHDVARRWWLETLHLADLAGAPELRVTALASMALQAGRSPNGGREVLALVGAARGAAEGTRPATAALHSLLAAREAVGHAHLHDAAAARRCLAAAWALLGDGMDEDRPDWLAFWGPVDLACHEARAELALRDGQRAETAARRAVESVDSDAYPQNHELCAAQLGGVLARRGKLDEAVHVVGAALHKHAPFGSRRIVEELATTVDVLERSSRSDRAVGEFVAYARLLLPAA